MSVCLFLFAHLLHCAHLHSFSARSCTSQPSNIGNAASMACALPTAHLGTCNPTCNNGYTRSGSYSCNLGSWTGTPSCVGEDLLIVSSGLFCCRELNVSCLPSSFCLLFAFDRLLMWILSVCVCVCLRWLVGFLFCFVLPLYARMLPGLHYRSYDPLVSLFVAVGCSPHTFSTGVSSGGTLSGSTQQSITTTCASGFSVGGGLNTQGSITYVCTGTGPGVSAWLPSPTVASTSCQSECMLYFSYLKGECECCMVLCCGVSLFTLDEIV